MTPFEYFQHVVTQKYADFTGRARRSEFWYFALFNFIGSILTVGVDEVLGTGFINGVYSLALLVPSIAVGVRRLHDTNRSGWWYLIVFIPIIGAIVLLVWFITEGTPGTNEYGTDPKNPDVDDITDHLVA
jgi:uncharacterized membrane protein YhaH (DUF805 family)